MWDTFLALLDEDLIALHKFRFDFKLAGVVK